MTSDPMCNYCARYIRGGKCEAFPQGIPDAILEDGAPHWKPYPGDNGVTFSPVAWAPPHLKTPPNEEDIP